MPQHGLGRLHAPDARDANFPMRSLLPARESERTYRYWNPSGWWGDQGNTPQCVAYAWTHWLEDGPVGQSGQAPVVQPSVLYAEAQKADEWPGENYDGTSVRGAMKAVVEYGLVKSYVWGQTVDEVIAWILGGYGTVVVGTNWYAEMSEVDAKGIMREPADWMTWPIGGHAWRVIWFDKKTSLFTMKNSWGHNFGYVKAGEPSGYAYVRMAFLERLLHEDGDCASPVQVKLTAVLPT